MAQLPEMLYFSVRQLEEQLGGKTKHFIRQSENDFLMKTLSVAEEIAWRPEVKLVFVSGPTSSGKTTTTARLSGALGLFGKRAHLLSMDDYYLPVQDSTGRNGRKDLESLHTLDLPALEDDLKALLDGEEVVLPTFDFQTRSRLHNAAKSLRLGEDDILLVEGLHGLAEEICNLIEPSARYGIMLRPWATVVGDGRLLSPRDIRMLRRCSRDVFHRNTPALATVDYWPMLDETEEQFFPAYLERADIFINTAVAYEACIIPQIACAALQADLAKYESGNLPPSPYVLPGYTYADVETAVAEARRLLKACSQLPTMGLEAVPSISILNEFIH